MLGLWKAPLYVTEPTMDALNRTLPDTLGKRLRGVETIHAGQRFSVGDIEVHAFAIPHDAADPIGFTFRADGVKLALVTDLGYMPALVKVHLRDADCMVLESNHDLDMLKVGPYPWSVKQRVMGRNGHLSNEVVSDFIRDGMDVCVNTLVLGHLSEHNNHPEIVRLVASQALSARAMAARLIVAEPKKPSEVF